MSRLIDVAVSRKLSELKTHCHLAILIWNKIAELFIFEFSLHFGNQNLDSSSSLRKKYLDNQRFSRNENITVGSQNVLFYSKKHIQTSPKKNEIYKN